MIGALILLGLTASIFLVFSNNLQYVRIGLVAALWAAVIGALAATRYRKDAAVDQAKVRDMQTVYELQLEREVNARREYEMGVEARVRAEVGADASEMAALRAELAVLRQNLQYLFEGSLPDDQPALQADAVRIDALPSGSFDAFESSDQDSLDSPTDADAAWFGPWQQPPSTLKPVFLAPVAANFADPYDDPVTAETSAVVLDEYAATADPFPSSPLRKSAPPRLSSPNTRVVADDKPAANGAAQSAKAQPANGTSTGGAQPNGMSASTSQPTNGTQRPANGVPNDTQLAGTSQVTTGTQSATASQSTNGTQHPTTAQSANSTQSASTSQQTGGTQSPNKPNSSQPTEPELAYATAEAKPKPTRLSDPGADPTPTPVGTPSRRRRRAQSEGDAPRLSVADIMANLQQESGAKSK
ncbi:hypothetical protein GCM10011591_35730 [Nocardia camponoti]|uniref:DUF6779 domain-containing protein n=2 Tax=Nocardia camponoti TaxID=1616106 RepID=A0A917QN11_9NOCA|nr:hypothetical protein GCM10011591_35730 [Nocardia camponoti]